MISVPSAKHVGISYAKYLKRNQHPFSSKTYSRIFAFKYFLQLEFDAEIVGHEHNYMKPNQKFNCDSIIQHYLKKKEKKRTLITQ